MATRATSSSALDLRTVIDDITELARTSAQADRAAASALLDALCQPLSCAALVANDAGEFVAANPVASELTGYSPRELLKLSVWQITPGAQEREAETLWRAFLQQREQSGEYRVLTKSRRVIVADYFARANVLPGHHVSLLKRDDRQS